MARAERPGGVRDSAHRTERVGQDDGVQRGRWHVPAGTRRCDPRRPLAAASRPHGTGVCRDCPHLPAAPSLQQLDRPGERGRRPMPTSSGVGSLAVRSRELKQPGRPSSSSSSGWASTSRARATDLSYGQRKLVELAQILMLDPAVILLDEPAAGVNPTLLRRLASTDPGAQRIRSDISSSSNTTCSSSLALRCRQRAHPGPRDRPRATRARSVRTTQSSRRSSAPTSFSNHRARGTRQ